MPAIITRAQIEICPVAYLARPKARCRHGDGQCS